MGSANAPMAPDAVAGVYICPYRTISVFEWWERSGFGIFTGQGPAPGGAFAPAGRPASLARDRECRCALSRFHPPRPFADAAIPEE